MTGIIEFHGTLIRADRVVYAEQYADHIKVTTDAFADKIVFENCTLEDFRNAWLMALNYEEISNGE